MFLSIDAFEPELLLSEYRESASERCGISMSLDLKSDDPSFIEANRISSDYLSEKEKELADSLVLLGFPQRRKGNLFKILYACISGKAKIYANQEVMGRKSGEDLSDLFHEESLGLMRYPDMTMSLDMNYYETGGYLKITDDSYLDYFEIGTVPLWHNDWCSVIIYPDLMNIDFYESLFSSNSSIVLHFEIPITGLDSNGEEKSIVLTGTYPVQKNSPGANFSIGSGGLL